MHRTLRTTITALALLSGTSSIALAQAMSYSIPAIPGSTFQAPTNSLDSSGFNATNGGVAGLSTVTGATGAANGGVGGLNGGFTGTAGGMAGAAGVIGGEGIGIPGGFGGHGRG
jgi:hypothetical protein